MMPAEEVVAVMTRLSEAGVLAFLDGGWGVDALLGEQTREHADLDLVVELSRADEVAGVLKESGYLPAQDERPTRLVLDAEDGRQIDLHTVVFDEGGGGVQGLPNGRSYRYPPEGFLARGSVAGVALPCLSAEVQLECHTGYEPTSKDRDDVSRLIGKFALSAPPAYRPRP